MKTGQIAISIIIFLGLLAGMAVPFVGAQETSAITFHELSNLNMTHPEDSEGTIVITGEYTGSESDGMGIILTNLCEGVGCSSVDIYYKFHLEIAWVSDWGGDYPEWVVAPEPHLVYGGSFHLITSIEPRCGSTGVSDECMVEKAGMIPAADIPTDQGLGHEAYHLGYDALYGGLAITTIYTITFSTSPIIENEADCAGQYNIGSALGSFTLAATNSAGVNLQTLLGSSYPAPGSWYVVRSSGSWQNQGTGDHLQTLGLKMGLNGFWFPLDANPSVECVSGDTYYLQMGTSIGAAYLRVYDQDSDFAHNTGSMSIVVYSVTARTRYPSGCELKYAVGDLIEQKTVAADFSYGWPMQNPFTPRDSGDNSKRYYMLETIGGPAWLGKIPGVYSFDADLGLRDSENDTVPDEWFEIITAPFVECVVVTDTVGHVKTFFVMDESILGALHKYYYAFRVRDTTTYADNSGALTFRLYQATFMQDTVPGVPPTAGGCNAFTHDAAATGYGIQGNDEDGTVITNLTSGAMYALEVYGGPWKDDGVDKYGVQISDDNGIVWRDLQDYPYLLCAASADGNHVIIYFYAAGGKIWRVRADDGDGHWENNTLSIGVYIHPASTLINQYPNCEDNYNLSMATLGYEDRKIPGNDSSGKSVSGTFLGARGPLIPGNIYSIEITDEEKWYEGGTGSGSYLVDISDDGGATWVTLKDYPSLCYQQIGLDNRGQIFFTAQSSDYKLRVRDADDNFLNNTGNVLFNLYLGVSISNPPPGSIPPPEWVVACNETYARPDSYFEWYPVGTIASVLISVPLPRVGEWIDYLRASIVFYFAWCPQHTEALKSMSRVYMDREPMASIQDMLDFVKSVQTLIDSYQVTGGEALDAGLISQEPDLFSDTQYIGVIGGENNFTSPATTGPWDLFMIGQVDPATNVWFGGQIDMAASLGTTDLSVMDAYQTLCSDKFYPLFGIGADPYCSLMSMMRFTNIVKWLLLGVDTFVSVLWLIKYLPGYLRRFWNIITGNKSTFKSIGSNL